MSKGLEYSFLKGWDGWDEVDCGVLQFGTPQFRDDVVGIPRHVIDQVNISGGGLFVMDCQTSSIQIYDHDGNEIFNQQVKLVLV